MASFGTLTKMHRFIPCKPKSLRRVEKSSKYIQHLPTRFLSSFFMITDLHRLCKLQHLTVMFYIFLLLNQCIPLIFQIFILFLLNPKPSMMNLGVLHLPFILSSTLQLRAITPKLTCIHYCFWKSQILFVVKAHGLEAHLSNLSACPTPFYNEQVDGSGSCSSKIKKPNPKYLHWKRVDNMLVSWLLGSLLQSIFSAISKCQYVSEIQNTSYSTMAQIQTSNENINKYKEAY